MRMSCLAPVLAIFFLPASVSAQQDTFKPPRKQLVVAHFEEAGQTQSTYHAATGCPLPLSGAIEPMALLVTAAGTGLLSKVQWASVSVVVSARAVVANRASQRNKPVSFTKLVALRLGPLP
jgi:hypothetical protein